MIRTMMVNSNELNLKRKKPKSRLRKSNRLLKSQNRPIHRARSQIMLSPTQMIQILSISNQQIKKTYLYQKRPTKSCRAVLICAVKIRRRKSLLGWWRTSKMTTTIWRLIETTLSIRATDYLLPFPFQQKTHRFLICRPKPPYSVTRQFSKLRLTKKPSQRVV